MTRRRILPKLQTGSYPDNSKQKRHCELNIYKPFLSSRLSLGKLKEIYNISQQEAMNNISTAFEFGKDNNPRLFKVAKLGWWKLA